ncbi:MAG: cbb3-type cytochrome c oxidase subunit II [Thermoleophilum sp.]|nr:cbb3-type cytochrome c oxidase subunit II [Thermoleophilum sp.]
MIILFAGIIATVLLPALEYTPPSPNARPYTESELRGMAIYKREGCVGCHTQQVRAPEANRGMVRTPGDIGAESLAGDYAYQSPVFWGTNRNGPDLARVSSRLNVPDPKQWHIQHLRAPRAFAAYSTMPSYAHLPQQDLEDLADYLLTLR